MTAPSLHCIGPADLLPGERRILEVQGESIGLFRAQDLRYYAVRNRCPHEGAELCRGEWTGTTLPTDRVGDYTWGLEDGVIRCPWHQWEFDLATGVHLANPKCKVRVWTVIEKDQQLYIER